MDSRCYESDCDNKVESTFGFRTRCNTCIDKKSEERKLRLHNEPVTNTQRFDRSGQPKKKDRRDRIPKQRKA